MSDSYGDPPTYCEWEYESRPKCAGLAWTMQIRDVGGKPRYSVICSFHLADRDNLIAQLSHEEGAVYTYVEHHLSTEAELFLMFGAPSPGWGGRVIDIAPASSVEVELHSRSAP